MRGRIAEVLWLSIFFGVFVWSAIDPRERFTWFLEVLPAIVGFAVLLLTRRRFPLTPLLYWLILAHMVVLMVGGHYTYAEVPFFDRLFGSERNNYDKLGHLFQGFVPAMIAREILIRKRVVPSRGWRNFFILCFVLALSAFYELIEWWVALASGAAADAFLGMQGDLWDTQSDMLFALAGGAAALLLLGRIHDRALRRAGFSGP